MDNSAAMSAIITAHNEGILAGVSLSSFLECVASARERGLAIEVLAVLDRGEPAHPHVLRAADQLPQLLEGGRLRGGDGRGRGGDGGGRQRWRDPCAFRPLAGGHHAVRLRRQGPRGGRGVARGRDQDANYRALVGGRQPARRHSGGLRRLLLRAGIRPYSSPVVGRVVALSRGVASAPSMLSRRTS